METNTGILLLHIASISLWGALLGFSYNKRRYFKTYLRFLLYGFIMSVIALLINDLQHFDFYIKTGQAWLIGNIGFPFILWLLIRHIEELQDEL
jgi:hypothetical protein